MELNVKLTQPRNLSIKVEEQGEDVVLVVQGSLKDIAEMIAPAFGMLADLISQKASKGNE
mgnify:CR=1 FL=1